MAEDDFPDELRDAQLRLHQARSAYRALCRELPWSVESAEGWTGEEGHYSGYRREFPASPGWTDAQRAEEATLRERVLTLSIEVSTHPYWAGLDRPEVVKARMALKHAEGAGALSPDGSGGDVSAGGSGGDRGRGAAGGGSGRGGAVPGSAGEGSGGAPPTSSAAA
ncbi:hypothetical protein HHX38_00510 [Streptomyces sp. PKU-MA01144]|uniref:hypothetical protein n=1 Tax=Streptomyces TaxID=1883 RepID=UPI00147C141B|nr:MULTISPECIES: hypothetical protein [Streptomyces]MCY0982796.1 hypothetical protein [Streptomyces tirandamycinicus]NNJ02635.1 hypothetical protein [Streptomyces sp. PKU-MA01144]